MLKICKKRVHENENSPWAFKYYIVDSNLKYVKKGTKK